MGPGHFAKRNSGMTDVSLIVILKAQRAIQDLVEATPVLSGKEILNLRCAGSG